MSMDGRRLTVLQMLPALESGGVERGTLEVARGLVREGHRSLVISTGGRMVSQLEAEGSEHLEWSVSKRSYLLALRHVWRLRDLLRRERVDVLHVRSRHPAWVAWLAWRGMPPHARPRFVTTAHGLYSVNAYSAVMARGERVIAISETVRDYLLRNYPRCVQPDRVEVIFRGVDPQLYYPGFRPTDAWRAAWDAEFPHTRQRPLLTLPGRLTRLKGHADFLNIIAAVRREIPDVCGVIAGGADRKRAGYERELHTEVARRGLGDAVVFTGHRNDLREILSISTVSYSLTNNPPEAFGRTIVEALSLGTPVIGYDRAGAGEILRQLHPQGAVAAGDVGSAMESTLHVLRGAPREIRPNELFTEGRMVAETLSLYHRAA
ncbi:MAG: glycosyltransferase family 4 protein [Planctomycetaceae bacterium]|nr:glycosyltransferase family 4 protein [Planctomycetaceae bacterium]